MMAPSLFSCVRTCALAAVATYIQAATAVSVSSTILVLARDTLSATNGATSGLLGYGIPYEVVTVPSAGIANLPTLNYTATNGQYGGIVVVSEVGYNYGSEYLSALTQAQWTQLYNYQTSFNVRMVRLDVFPTTDFGTVALGGNANDEPVYLTNVTGFQTAGLKSNAAVNITGIYHNPANITNPAIAWEVARFSTGTAAVINSISGRQQMVWFMPFALDWAPVSAWLQHAWIHWLTRGLYVGFRRTYLNTQVDDMFLETPIYSPAGKNFRCTPADLDMVVAWQTDINKRFPKGSEYFIEIGHNGNGDIEASTDTDDGYNLCNPSNAIEYADQPDGWNLEYAKPPGTGTNIWPATPTAYTWSLECAQIDPLQNWFADATNRDNFAHISHTFTHEDLTNSTYSDTSKEISWNQVWLKQVGLSSAKRFSPNGIIPPAITGLHNADALRAWKDNGIVNVVGDNTRPVLMNTDHPFWVLNTTVAANGYAGINVMPRWASVIYYNCDLPACTLAEWKATSAGQGTFVDLMNSARDTGVRNLMGLHWDAYMFHQANLRTADVPTTTVNGVSGQYSLLATWVETITYEMMRLTTWPFKTLKHDDLAAAFLARQTRDLCRPSMTWTSSADGKGIASVTVYTAGGNKCGTTIPVTFPVTPSSTTGATKEQIGTDPLTLWISMTGAAQTYTFSKPIPF